MTLPKSEILSQLQTIGEYEFEALVAETWEQFGWETTVTSRSSDQGVDVIATKTTPFEQKVVIQAKRYVEDNPVGSPDIQQYSSLRHQEDGVDAVIVVTTSSFTSAAEQAAENLNVKLIDGDMFINVLQECDSTPIIEKYIDGQSELADRVLVENYLEYTNSPPWESSKVNAKCPFCGDTVTATRDAFMQHWRDNTSCSPPSQREA